MRRTPYEKSFFNTLLVEKTALLIMTQMCCDTTAREAAHRGFKVLLLADATAAMDLKAADGSIIPHDQVHRTHLASLNGFLAQVTTTDQVVK